MPSRALLSHRVTNQAGAVQPYTSVLILEVDGTTPLVQTLYAEPTGGATRANPLTTDSLGMLVAYADTPQRAIARVGSGDTAIDTVIHIEDDPADLTSPPIAVAGLAPGAANQGLLTNPAGTLAIWGASPQSLLTGTGDLLTSSAPNVPARLGLGTARQALMVNAAGNGLAYGTSLLSLLTSTGDIPYASAANTPARLAVGANGTVLTLAGGLPTWAAPVTTTVGVTNVLVNGTFSVSQRGMPTADNAYCLDRWRLLLGAANAATVAQETADLPAGGARTAIRLTVGATNNNKFGIFQIIEAKDMWHLRGGIVSLQFKAKATAAITDMRAAVVVTSGTEDNGGVVYPDPINVWGATGTVPTYGAWANVGAPANLNPTTSWATYLLENISIASGVTNIAVFIWCEDTTTTTTTDILRIADVQLNAGATAGTFERRDRAGEMPRCQRYFCKTFPLPTAPAQNAGATGNLAYTAYGGGLLAPNSVNWRFPVQMRTTPTLTTYNPAAANANWRNHSLAADSGTPTLSYASEAGVFIANPQVGGDTAGTIIAIHATADAEL